MNTYQWQLFNGTAWEDLTDTGPYSGTNTDTLLITNATNTNDGESYRVLVSNTVYQCDLETSTAVDLSIAVNTVISNRRITYRVNKN